MKDYIEERAVEIAYYIIENQATVRQTAKKFGVSKSTIHIDVTKDVFLNGFCRLIQGLPIRHERS
mgnify:CR=1 FL=1